MFTTPDPLDTPPDHPLRRGPVRTVERLRDRLQVLRTHSHRHHHHDHVLHAILTELEDVEVLLLALIKPHPTIVLDLTHVVVTSQPAPTGVFMATITLKPTEIHTIPLGIVDPNTNQSVPVPSGDVFSASSSSGSVSATIGTDASGAPALIVNALTLPGPSTMGVVVEVTDSAGDVAVDLTVDYPVPASPGDIVLNTGGDVVTSQAAPTAPAP